MIKQWGAVIFITLLVIANIKAEGAEKDSFHGMNLKTDLQLERWMTDEKTWDSNSGSVEVFFQDSEIRLPVQKTG